jgi:hypothetical protein
MVVHPKQVRPKAKFRISVETDRKIKMRRLQKGPRQSTEAVRNPETGEMLDSLIIFILTPLKDEPECINKVAKYGLNGTASKPGDTSFHYNILPASLAPSPSHPMRTGVRS